ncbi:hypothetical protein [Gordonia terrae]
MAMTSDENLSAGYQNLFGDTAIVKIGYVSAVAVLSTVLTILLIDTGDIENCKGNIKQSNRRMLLYPIAFTVATVGVVYYTAHSADPNPFSWVFGYLGASLATLVLTSSVEETPWQ